jgi:hypothetical protein
VGRRGEDDDDLGLVDLNQAIIGISHGHDNMSREKEMLHSIGASTEGTFDLDQNKRLI